MEILAPTDNLASLMTWDPFCAQEGVKTLQSAEHAYYLARIVGDLQLHLETQELPYTLTSDLLIRNVPLKEGVAPDVALWPGHRDLVGEKCGSLTLSADLCPALILEVVSERTWEADADTKYEIYRLAGIGEYWLYDPEEYAGGDPLCGWQLVEGTYMPIRAQEQEDSGEAVTRYPSTVLQTDWSVTADKALRLWNPRQRAWYQMTPAGLRESWAQTEQARAQAEQERARAEQAEARSRQAAAEIARLRTLLDMQADQNATPDADL